MKIAVMLHYYHPERVSSFFLFDDIISELKSRGHQVTVITPLPSRGIDEATRQQYKKRRHEVIDDIEVIRVKTLPHRGNFILRLLRYFQISARCARQLKKVKPDLVFLQSDPPIFYGRKVIKYTNKHKVPLIYNLQDIYPENLNKSGFAVNVLRKMHRKVFAAATEITTLSADMKKTIVDYQISQNKVHVIGNWAPEMVELSKEQVEHLKETIDYQQDKFNVFYIGNIGWAQNTPMILEAARLLKDDRSIRFTIVGDGIAKATVEKMKSEHQLDNVVICNPVSLAEAQQLYNLANVNLITLKPGVVRSACPSKTGPSLKAQKPILATVEADSYYARMIADHHLGSVAIPGDVASFINALNALKSGEVPIDKDEYIKVFNDNFEKHNSLDKYLTLIEKYK